MPIDLERLMRMGLISGDSAARMGQRLNAAGQDVAAQYQAMPSWADKAQAQVDDPRDPVQRLREGTDTELAMGMVGPGTIKGPRGPGRRGLSRGEGTNEKFTRPVDPTADLTAASQPMTDEAFQNALNDPASRLQRLYGRYGGTPPDAANSNKSQAQIKAELPEPLSRADRDWQNYGVRMHPDEVLNSEVVWGAGRLGAEQGLGRAESFAQAANDLWRRMGANRYITPEQARRHIAVEEGRMRGIKGVEGR